MDQRMEQQPTTYFAGQVPYRQLSGYTSRDEKPLPSVPRPARRSVVSQRTVSQRTAQRSVRRNPSAKHKREDFERLARTPGRLVTSASLRRRNTKRVTVTPKLVMAEAFGELKEKESRPLPGKSRAVMPEPVLADEVHPAFRAPAKGVQFDLTPRIGPNSPVFLTRSASQRKSAQARRSVFRDLLPRTSGEEGAAVKQRDPKAQPLKRRDTPHPVRRVEQLREVRKLTLLDRIVRSVFPERRVYDKKPAQDDQTVTTEEVSDRESLEQARPMMTPAITRRNTKRRSIAWTATNMPVKRRNSRLAGRSSMGTIQRIFSAAGVRNTRVEEWQIEAAQEKQQALGLKYRSMIAAAKHKRDLELIDAEDDVVLSSPLSLQCRGDVPPSIRSKPSLTSKPSTLSTRASTVFTQTSEESDATPNIQPERPRIEVYLQPAARPTRIIKQLPVEESHAEDTQYDASLLAQAMMGSSFFGSSIDEEDFYTRTPVEDVEERPHTPALTADIDETTDIISPQGHQTARAGPNAAAAGVGRSSSVYSAQSLQSAHSSTRSSARLQCMDADTWVHLAPESIPISAEEVMRNGYLSGFGEGQGEKSASLSPPGSAILLFGRHSSLESGSY